MWTSNYILLFIHTHKSTFIAPHTSSGPLCAACGEVLNKFEHFAMDIIFDCGQVPLESDRTINCCCCVIIIIPSLTWKHNILLKISVQRRMYSYLGGIDESFNWICHFIMTPMQMLSFHYKQIFIHPYMYSRASTCGLLWEKLL